MKKEQKTHTCNQCGKKETFYEIENDFKNWVETI